MINFACLKTTYIYIPEVIMQGWMNDYIYYPDLTMDCLTDYAKNIWKYL